MTRLYLRVMLLMFLTFVVGIFIILASWGGMEKLYFRPYFAEQMRNLAGDLEHRLEGRSMEEARAELAKLESSQRLIFQIEVVESVEAEPAGSEAALYFRPSEAPYLLRFQPDPAQFRMFQQNMGNRFLVALLVSGILIFLAALIVVLPLVRKMRLQEQTISAIAEGDLEARAPEGNDPLGKVGRRLNHMTGRIRELLSGQRHLIHAVSHEMRTPTARLGFGLEMLADAATAEERAKRIAAMQEDLGEMDALLDELLSYLRFEQADDSWPFESLDLRKLVAELQPRVEPFGRGIEVVSSGIPPGATVRANGHHFPRALENLLRNAVRHANSRVVIRYAADADHTIVHIDDDGPGIPASERQRIFEPFIRLDTSRDRKTGGAGLGLAIADRIVARHGGSLTVGDSPEEGARLTIRLSA